jgi:MerR family transcriptional regulator, light-induced transcriptional regulator
MSQEGSGTGLMRLQDAADMLGVHYQTAYGWVRGGRLPARLVAGGYQVAEPDVRALQAERQLGRKPASAIQVRDWPGQASKLYEAITAGQETQARRLMERLIGHVPMTVLCDNVIGPALRQIGDGWATGAVTIAQEHRATAICERLITVSQPAGRPRGAAVVGTPASERHGMPALMAAACLREQHWQVHHLAADLPATEISALAQEVAAELVVLSTASADGVAAATAAASLVRSEVPGAIILIGRSGDTLADLIRKTSLHFV